MSNIREVAGYSGSKQEIFNLSDLSLLSSISLKDVQEIKVEDGNGRIYYFKQVLKRGDELDPTDETIALENVSSTLDDIKETFIMLNDDQRNIVTHIYYLYKNKNPSEDNPKIILQGPAGTGKSTIINFIEKLITWEENKSSDSPQNMKVLKCAFTGKAASNINGNTLHHILSIPPKYKTRSLSKKTNALKQEILKSCVFFICDEISMVGKRVMTSVNERLQQIFANNKLYGDRYVLLVGDLYQLNPVKDTPLFPGSELWTCCKFYELTTIVRQSDQDFINALNNFRDSNMTEEDIKLLRSREISDTDEVPKSVVHLFFLNDHVDEHNIKIIDSSSEREVTVNCFEDSDNWKPSFLRLKIGIRYMITCNMNVGDGLANGTTGVVKDFEYDNNGEVNIVWMEFHSAEIGKTTRQNYWDNNDPRPGFENWVPIPQSKMTVTLKTDKNKSRTIPKMFPLKPAEAITVHKSQGQTYHEGACIHVTDHPRDRLRNDKSLQYVALTRVKRIEDLYIVGTFQFSVQMTEALNRKETEINVLRTERKLKLAFETFEDKTSDVIIYLNTGLTFNEHYQFITSDKWYGNASLLIFTETNTIGSDDIKIPNFELAFRSDRDTVIRSGGGILCYKQSDKSLEVISSIANDDNETYFTLLRFEKSFYIIVGVKGNLTNDDFELAVDQLMKRVGSGKCIAFIADLQITYEEVFIQKNFDEKLSCVTDVEGQNDVIFTRNCDVLDKDIGFYQYIPAPHKPMYVKLPSNPKVMEPTSSSQRLIQDSMEVD